MGCGVEVTSVDDAERLGVRVEPGALLKANRKAPWRNIDCPPTTFPPFLITYNWTDDLDDGGRQSMLYYDI